MNHSINKRLKILKYIYSALFLFICLYLTYFSIFEARAIAANSYNRRLGETESNVLRGQFLDRNNDILVKSTAKNKTRVYTYKNLFSHIIGYTSKSNGSSALEAYYNKELTHSDNRIATIKDKAEGNMVKGNNIRLTVDRKLQEYAASQIRGKKGSVVVLNPKTGEILAMVSKPDFNPSTIKDDWSDLIEDETSPLINRAAEGLYPPGSIFKVVTASAAITNNQADNLFECNGKVNIDGYEIKDFNNEKHGKSNLVDAFKHSCNAYFIQEGGSLGIDKLFAEAVKFRFNKPIVADFKVSLSIFPKENDKKSIAEQAIGQGETLITPIHAALIASTVANQGIMMQPYMVSNILDSDNKVIKTFKPKQMAQVIDKKAAEQLKGMMVEVVNNGTGTKAQTSRYKIAGKTGTAENSKGRDHAWFIGFAPADNPQVAIAVLIENGGGGGTTAAPIAGRILRKAITLIK